MARKGGYGHPGDAGLAQSGGRNTTFGGGKGGTAFTRGATDGKVEGHGSQNGVNKYAIRADSGNAAKVKLKGKAGKPPPVHAGGAGQATAIVKPRQLPPALRGSDFAKKGKYR